MIIITMQIELTTIWGAKSVNAWFAAIPSTGETAAFIYVTLNRDTLQSRKQKQSVDWYTFGESYNEGIMI